MSAPGAPEYAALQRWQSAALGPAHAGRRAEGRGPTLHFLSGNGFCGGVYWPWLRRFLPEYGLFLHDVDGQGESAAPARFGGAQELAARIARVIREQLPQGAPLIGMGHSFGAQLTVLLAAREPGLFKALVLTDPILFPLDKWLAVRVMTLLGQHPFGKAARRRRDRWSTRAEAAAHLRGRGIYRGWSEEAFQCFVEHAMEERAGEWTLRCPREIEAQIFEQPAWPWAAFRQIDVPILFLRGAQSYPFFPQAERWALRHNPRVTVQQLPGGHCFMQEDPAAAHAAVAEFLRGL